MAEDLRHFLREQTVIQSGASPGGIESGTSETKLSAAASTSIGSSAASTSSTGLASSGNQPIRIVPEELRSFDAHDADLPYGTYQMQLVDKEQKGLLDNSIYRVMRGGSFKSPEPPRSALRSNNQPDNGLTSLGFRGGRTLPPGP